MRALADASEIRRFMEALGRESDQKADAYFTGGATAVLIGWRPSTIDIDVRFEPERDSILRAIPDLKEKLQINIEFASPADFIPVLPDWVERSTFIESHGMISFFHFDLYAQALAKAVEYFEAIEPNLFRFPALDPRSFRESVEQLMVI